MAAGVRLHQPARALDVGADARGKLARVRIGHGDSSTETDLPATRVVVCAGAWTSRVLAELRDVARRLIRCDGEPDVVRAGLCFRPVTARGTPYLARLDDELLGGGIRTRPGAEGGVFVAAGHGPWGIALSLGTGMVMAEMMSGKSTSVDISGLGL